MRRSQILEIVVFSVKNNFIRHLTRFNFSRLSLALILKYYPTLHAVKRELDWHLKTASNYTQNQLVICSLPDMLQDTPFLLSLYMLIIIREVLP